MKPKRYLASARVKVLVTPQVFLITPEHFGTGERKHRRAYMFKDVDEAALFAGSERLEPPAEIAAILAGHDVTDAVAAALVAANKHALIANSQTWARTARDAIVKAVLQHLKK